MIGRRAAEITESAGQVHPDRLITESGRDGEVDQYPPVIGDQSGLLAQFPRRRVAGILSGRVEQSGRQFPQPTPQRVAVLVDHRQLAVVVDGSDCDRAVVLDHLAHRGAAAGHQHLIGAQRENRSLIDGFAGECLEFVVSHGHVPAATVWGRPRARCLPRDSRGRAVRGSRPATARRPCTPGRRRRRRRTTGADGWGGS